MAATPGERFLLDDYAKQCERTARAEQINADLMQLVKDFCHDALPAADGSGCVLSKMPYDSWDYKPDAWQPRARRVLAGQPPVDR